MQVEAQFHARGITAQQTKYYHIVGCLSSEIATEIRDLLLHPPDDHPYDALKQKLIERTAASEQRRLQQLFTTEELGDRKPTQLLRRMQQLLGDKPELADSSILKELFMQRMPTNVRMVLAAVSESTPLQELATLADKIMEVATPSIATVTTPTSTLQQLQAKIDRLEEELSAFQAAPKPRKRRSRGRNQGRSHSPSRSAVYWYHRRFRDAARKCTPPCAKSENQRASN